MPTRCINVQDIHRILLDLKEKGRAQNNSLVVHQVSQLGTALCAWERCKHSQSESHQAEICALINSISHYSLGTEELLNG